MNKIFKNIGVSGYLKRYGIRYGITRGLFIKIPLHFVRDTEMKKALYYRKAERYIVRKYGDKYGDEPAGLQYGDQKLFNPVWFYWEQGIENAPTIVKLCYQSIKKYYSDRLVLLSKENLKDYIVLPTYITNKVSSSHISAAALSDLIRFSLLEEWGGVWIDATVLLTERLPYYMTESDFFVYVDSFGRISNSAMFESWFIHSNPHNEIIREIRNMLFAYWKKEKYTKEYLLCYIFAKISIFRDQDNYRIWEKSPYIISEYAHRLFEILGDTFCQEKFDYLCSITPVHKLSYKIDFDNMEEDNYYNYIIRKYGEE